MQILASRARSVMVIATAIVAALAIAAGLDPVAAGLSGSCFASADWSGPPSVTSLDSRLNTDSVVAAWRGQPPETFSTTWSGSILALRRGTYSFATVSDDGSWVYVDGRRVVDNGGRHGVQRAEGSIHLEQGVHSILIQYVQDGGQLHFEWSWGRDGGAHQTVPAWALTPRRAPFWLFVVSAGVRSGLAVAEWLWLLTMAGCAALWTWRRIERVRGPLERDGAWPALPLILLGSLLLNVTAVWWGLPGGSWAPDELTPAMVMLALEQRFSDGWSAKYPPFHFFVLRAGYGPVWLLGALGRIDRSGDFAYFLQALLGRLISVAAGSGILAALYVCGRRLFGSRPALFATGLFALVAPFAYYSKTANLDVPYVFWFALSLVFYLKMLDGVKARDFAAFTVCATLAVCTKDQAYGLYLLVPFVMVARVRRSNRAAGVGPSWARAVFDRRIGLSAGTAAVVFSACHNLLFNWTAFLDHVRLITGGASQTYRMFAPTLSGEVALLGLTLRILRLAWGWPLFCVAASGVGLVLFEQKYRQAAVVLAAPIASYYLGFIAIVGYNYDRFMLPVCFVLAVFGGLALDRFLPTGESRSRARLAVAAGVLAYSLAYAATVDLLMLRDSRYTVERWLSAHVGSAEGVGYVFPSEYYPRLLQVSSAEIKTVERLDRVRPAWFVLNADYARAEPPTSPIGILIAGLESGSLGYREAFRYRGAPPWPGLPGAHPDLAGPRDEWAPLVTSALRHVNPTFEVFRRVAPAP